MIRVNSSRRPPCSLALIAAMLGAALYGQPSLPPEPVPLDSLGAFRTPAANWKLAGGLGGDPRTDKVLVAAPGVGVLVCNPTAAERGHLFTAFEHGDIEFELEFLLPPGSNSGVYLQGRYEVQLFDSWGVPKPSSADAGGIYVRYDAKRGQGKERFEGAAPRVNAARAPGLWQKLHVTFEAPRFDAAGHKIRNARFVRVVLNGFVIHENVEVTGPTRAAAFNDEKPLGPLMVQGDHGPVAVRNVAVKKFDPTLAILAENVRYKRYAGDFKAVGGYPEASLNGEGVLTGFAHEDVDKTGKFALVFTGTLNLPREGTYRFTIESGSLTRLIIGGRTVIVPLDQGSPPGDVHLAAGRHEFLLDFVHNMNPRPTFAVFAEGPEIARQSLSGKPVSAATKPGPKPRVIEPDGRVLVQRGFVPFEPRKRLYAISVGSPTGVHYAYDFETGAVLRAWRQSFVDVAEMWDGRGANQIAKPTGPALTFNSKPAIALIEFARDGGWPEEPEPLYSSHGYRLEPDGQPVFLAQLADLTIRDRIAPAAERRGLTRTLEVTGKLPAWSTWVLLADSDRIERAAAGIWVIGDREWYVDLPADSPHQPVLRSVGDRRQLAIHLKASALGKPVTYTIVW